MGLLNMITGRKARQVTPAAEHAVLVYFRYGSTDLPRLFALEELLEEVITVAGARPGIVCYLSCDFMK